MPTIVRVKDNVAVITNTDFFSLVDFAKERTSALELDQQASRHRRANKNKAFFGSATFEEAYTLAERGDHELAKLVAITGEAMYERMSNLVVKPMPYYSDDPGITFDVERVIEGDPECYLHIEDIVKSGQGRSIVRLIFNATSDAAISDSVIKAKGATVASLVMMLENSGCGVEVVMYMGTQGAGKNAKRAEIYTTVKQADQPIHILTLAFALAHPATLRRFGFAELESLPLDFLAGIKIPGSYGFPSEATHRGDVYVPSSRFGALNWADPKLAQKWVIDQLREQGVNLREDALP